MLIEQETSTTGSPVDQRPFSAQKTARLSEPTDRPVERAPDGVWHIRDYDLARAILRAKDTRQAGFKVDLAEQMPGLNQKPVLFQDGPDHQAQRKEIGRFFSPTTTRDNYQAMMEAYSDEMIANLKAKGRVDLSELTMKLAVRVAAEVVGLTDSILPGMANRLNRFFVWDPGDGEFSWNPGQIAALLRSNYTTFSFYLWDVRPAIRARKKRRREDVISHLIDKGYRDLEILVECITYGAAGMVTTREFIQIAAWHLLENPELKAIYLAGSLEERHRLLEEILRLEPVVANLYRRATADLTLEVDGETITIPEGEVMDLHIYAINADQSVVGADPLAIIPERELAKRAQPPVMGFGFGHHRCPGAFIAIQESDIFLHRLLAIEGLRIIGQPQIAYNDLIKSYEFRGFQVGVER